MKHYERMYYYDLWAKLRVEELEKYLPDNVKLIWFITFSEFRRYCIDNNIEFKHERFPWNVVFNRYHDIFLLVVDDKPMRIFTEQTELKYYTFNQYFTEDCKFIKTVPPFYTDEYKNGLKETAQKILDSFDIEDLQGFISENSEDV